MWNATFYWLHVETERCEAVNQQKVSIGPSYSAIIFSPEDHSGYKNSEYYIFKKIFFNLFL